VARSGRGSGDERCGTTDESAVTSGCDDDEGLATLDRRRCITGITLVLIDCEGLSGDGGLIDLEEGVVGDDATVGWNDGTLLGAVSFGTVV
jgi:hypothetical protein